MKITERQLQELIDVIFRSVAKLSRHRYFANELWTRLGKWDHNDKADIQAAFVSKCIYESIDIPLCPVGISWAVITDDKSAEEYHHQYDDLWKDYIEWCNEQR